MAEGKYTDFQVYEDEFFGGMVETLQQFAGVFNGASENAIRLVPRRMAAHYETESFFKAITGLVSRRDISSVSTVTDTPLTQGEMVGVKVNRRIGPVANTLDSFRKIGQNPSEASFRLGAQMGQAVALDYLNTGLKGLVATFASTNSLSSTLIYDATALSADQRTLRHTHLIRTMAKMGDAANRIKCWVMHSKPFFDLMENAVTDKIFEVAGVTIYRGTVPSFNRPIIVTDSASLWVDATTDTYHVMGLVEDALILSESEERQIVSEIVTGKENLIMRIQGEYAFNVRVKGMAFASGAGVNPTDAALATATNWTSPLSDKKLLAGVRLLVE